MVERFGATKKQKERNKKRKLKALSFVVSLQEWKQT
jgi:hypothetical protein